MSEQLRKVLFMVNVNDFLTDEQIGMLISELSNNDLVALFLMNDEEKFDYFRDYRNVWVSNYDGYNKQFDKLAEESLYYKASDRSKYLDYCERMHSLFINMQHCSDFIRIYDILLDHI